MKKTAKYRDPVHPGVVLKADLLQPLGMSVNKLATELHVPANRLGQIISGKRGISPDTSLRLARYFGFSPEYWLNMQAQYDLEVIRRQSMRRIEKEIKPREAA
jgi:antitoxin HigA-1